MKLAKRKGGIEQIKARYGWLFISTWLIGVVLFFFVPIVQSIIYSFSETTLEGSNWVGLQNYDNIINKDTKVYNIVKHYKTKGFNKKYNY